MGKPNKDLVLVSRKDLTKLKKDLDTARARIAALESANAQFEANQHNIMAPDDNGKVYLSGHTPANTDCGC